MTTSNQNSGTVAILVLLHARADWEFTQKKTIVIRPLGNICASDWMNKSAITDSIRVQFGNTVD